MPRLHVFVIFKRLTSYRKYIVFKRLRMQRKPWKGSAHLGTLDKDQSNKGRFVNDDVGGVPGSDIGTERLPEFSRIEAQKAIEADDPGSPLMIKKKTVTDLEEVIALANDMQRPVHIQGALIEKARICTARVSITIEASFFVDDLHWESMHFNQPLRFHDVDFQNKVRFRNSGFAGSVYFDGCVFHDETDFTAACFWADFDFLSCRAHKKVSFEAARMGGSFNLGQSTFYRKVVFRNAVLGKAIDLDNVRFEVGYDARGSTLEKINKTPSRQGGAQTTRKTFNPWTAFDRVSKKQMSRRDLFRGIRNLIPKKDDT